MPHEPFATGIAEHIWRTKYRCADDGGEASITDTWRRVANAVATAEGSGAGEWAAAFYDALADFRFLPGGRILAGAGTGHRVTLFNCFVMGRIDDSMDAIFDALKQGALTMQAGGGVGYDFSTLRPAGSRTHDSGNIASGPVSFMRIWDATCQTLLSTGARRGAMMATLRCDHPDIGTFIDAKRSAGELSNFNVSVLVTDEFMQAVADDAPWQLVFPAASLAGSGGATVERTWSGAAAPEPCRVLGEVSARALWERILAASYECAEPGVLFVDRINATNNLHYRERLSATNPCGEIPLPSYGACDLGSINLTRFVEAPFTGAARIDLEAIEALVPTVVRFLDDVIDVSQFPLAEQAAEARTTRRIGLGFTGLGNALVMLGLEYGTPDACEAAGRIMRCIRDAAYAASVTLAEEKGAFPAFAPAYLQAPGIAALPAALRRDIERMGIRNSHLTAIAPTGTVSLLADNVSSGIEPSFAASYRRKVLETDGTWREYDLEDYACRVWRTRPDAAGLPEAFVTAGELTPSAHLAMQAAVQPFVDNAISKTVNVPESMAFEDYREIYGEAYALDLKGCTTYRPNPVRAGVLSEPADLSHCCTIEREAD